MIAFESDSTVKNGMGGIIKPIVVCDYCHTRIEGSGNALWIMPDDINSKRFIFESPVFHTHKHCNHAFEMQYMREHGFYGFFWEDLWEHLTQMLNNVVAPNERHRKNIYNVAERAMKAAREKS